MFPFPSPPRWGIGEPGQARSMNDRVWTRVMQVTTRQGHASGQGQDEVFNYPAGLTDICPLEGRDKLPFVATGKDQTQVCNLDGHFHYLLLSSLQISLPARQWILSSCHSERVLASLAESSLFLIKHSLATSSEWSRFRLIAKGKHPQKSALVASIFALFSVIERLT